MPSRDNIEPKQEQKMDISAHGYDSVDNRNSIGLSDTFLCGRTANQESEIGYNQRTTSDSERANKGDGGDESMDDTASLETFRARSGRKDAVLYIGPSEQGDLREKRQILHTYENGVEDDDVRRSIVQRKRELDADDQERKERTRIAEEGLDRKIREKDREFATIECKFDRTHAIFDGRLRSQNIRIVASAKRKIREVFGSLKAEINRVSKSIQRTIGKIRILEREVSRIATNRQNFKSTEEITLDMDEELLESPDNTWEMSM